MPDIFLIDLVDFTISFLRCSNTLNLILIKIVAVNSCNISPIGFYYNTITSWFYSLYLHVENINNQEYSYEYLRGNNIRSDSGT